MKTICVLEYPEHFSALRRDKRGWKNDITFYCASMVAEDELRRQGIPFETLTADLLSTEWDAMNRWAIKASLGWFREPPYREALVYKGLNIGDLVYRPVSHALAYQLKIQRLLDHLLSRAVFDHAIVFDDYTRKGIRYAREGRSLNSILSRRLSDQNVRVSRIPCYLRYVQPTRARDIFRYVLTFLLAPLTFKRGKIRFFGMGSDKHLMPLLGRLGLKDRVAFVDQGIHGLVYRDCRKHGIEYALADSFIPGWKRARLHWDIFRFQSRFKKLACQIPESAWLHYQGKPVLGAREAISQVVGSGLFPRLKQRIVCQTLFEERGAEALILHEEIGFFRIAAQAGRQLGKAIVVLSHGIPSTTNDQCDWSGEVPNLGVGETIVNSEFEKDKYLKAAFSSASQLHVLGLPRFDLIHARIVRGTPHRNATPVVLYCPQKLRELAKHRMGYLGIHTPKGLTQAYTLAVIAACGQTGTSLWIKLHDNQNDKLWRDLIKPFSSQGVRLFSHKADLFDLLEKCDLLVTTFSSVVMEALSFGKDVITLNFTGEPDIHPYADYGVALAVRHPEELAGTLRIGLSDAEVRERLKENRKMHAGYFCGPLDGRNTDRAAQFVRGLAGGGAIEDPESKGCTEDSWAR